MLEPQSDLKEKDNLSILKIDNFWIEVLLLFFLFCFLLCLDSILHMKVTATAKKSSHQVCGPCISHFFFRTIPPTMYIASV